MLEKIPRFGGPFFLGENQGFLVGGSYSLNQFYDEDSLWGIKIPQTRGLGDPSKITKPQKLGEGSKKNREKLGFLGKKKFLEWLPGRAKYLGGGEKYGALMAISIMVLGGSVKILVKGKAWYLDGAGP